MAPSDYFDPQAPRYIVGIGASAGGLEALQLFFENLDTDTGSAFVVVQHLSPDFKSVMRELLARTTNMPIHNVTDNVRVAANNIYLIPPRMNMVAERGALRLTEKPAHHGLNLPIDTFFTSLALDQESRSVAIILSGTGSDGSRGILDIKDAGGYIFVQDPEDAQFDGMPNSAARTGLADMVLPVRDIPNQLNRFINSSNDQNAPIDESDESLHQIFSILRKKTGVDFSKYKIATVARRLERRMKVNEVEDLRAYSEILRTNGQEPSVLCRELLINVTRFFRDKDAFEQLDRAAIQEIVAKAQPNEEIRIWCAGCATGEEAYSLAMLVDEAMERQNVQRNVKVFATDVDQEVIASSALGRYDESVFDDLGKTRAHRYLHRDTDGKYSVVPLIRRRVVFAAHDITRDPPFSNMDLVVCRNLLIYLRNDIQQQVLTQLLYAVKPNGYLFLGSSEALGDLSKHFEVLNHRAKLFRKQNQPGNRAAALMLNSALPNRPNNANRTARSQPSMQTALAETLLQQFLPPSIIIDDNDEAVHVYGDVTPYIKKLGPGSVANRLNRLLVDALQVPVSTAIHKARSSEEEVLYENILLDSDASVPNLVNLKVSRVTNPNIVDHIALTFTPGSSEEPTSAQVVRYDAESQATQRLQDLENELKHTREHLQVTIEELETTNEELQASNEELLAANEELQSTNEELQSVNEELYTVNSEYQEKIQEVTEVNDDLTNLLKNAQLAFVFLHADNTIRRFTESSQRYVNLVDQDIGRPFGHMTHNLQYSRLMSDILEVTASNTAKKSMVAGPDDSKIQVNIEPFFDSNNQPSGIALSFFDSTELRNTREQLEQTEMLLQEREQELQFDIALDITQIGLWRWDLATKAMHWDRRMLQLAKISDSNYKTTISSWSENCYRQDATRLDEAVHKLQLGEAVDIRFRLETTGEQPTMTHLQGQPIVNTNGEIESVVGVWLDISREHQRQLALSQPIERKVLGNPESTKILIIDDEPQDCYLVEQILKRSQPSWILHSCHSIEAARKELSSDGFDAILLDLSLPDATGLEGTAHIRKAVPDVPIVLLTANEDEVLLQEALSYGVQDYITKRNLNGDSMITALRKAMLRSALQQI